MLSTRSCAASSFHAFVSMVIPLVVGLRAAPSRTFPRRAYPSRPQRKWPPVVAGGPPPGGGHGRARGGPVAGAPSRWRRYGRRRRYRGSGNLREDATVTPLELNLVHPAGETRPVLLG